MNIDQDLESWRNSLGMNENISHLKPLFMHFKTEISYIFREFPSQCLACWREVRTEVIYWFGTDYVDGLVQERRSFSASATELRLSYNNPSM